MYAYLPSFYINVIKENTFLTTCLLQYATHSSENESILLGKNLHKLQQLFHSENGSLNFFSESVPTHLYLGQMGILYAFTIFWGREKEATA